MPSTPIGRYRQPANAGEGPAVSKNTLKDVKADIKDRMRGLEEATGSRFAAIEARVRDAAPQDALTNLDAKVGKIHAALLLNQERDRNNTKSVEDLEHVVYGNGRPGVKADVQEALALSKTNKDRIDSIRSEQKEASKERKKLLLQVAGAAAGSTGVIEGLMALFQ